ncbi:MAG: hypothetical protein IKK17_05805 [Oscillospiraceae bacterium]|nr:hypothetical protein [Oscillospiraceae bacterium]
MKSVLISIHPKWCEKIANRGKVIEVRKTRPKLETPFKCYIYCTNTRPYLVWGDVFRGNWETEFTHISGYSRKRAEEIWDVFNGNVIGEFICDKIHLWNQDVHDNDTITLEEASKLSCLSEDELLKYADGYFYGWHISDLVIYDEPKELREFAAVCKYKNDDGTCPAKKVECFYQQFDYNQDGSINLVECGKKIERPPQSWCYVEDGDT